MSVERVEEYWVCKYCALGVRKMDDVKRCDLMARRLRESILDIMHTLSTIRVLFSSLQSIATIRCPTQDHCTSHGASVARRQHALVHMHATTTGRSAVIDLHFVELPRPSDALINLRERAQELLSMDGWSQSAAGHVDGCRRMNRPLDWGRMKTLQ